MVHKSETRHTLLMVCCPMETNYNARAFQWNKLQWNGSNNMRKVCRLERLKNDPRCSCNASSILFRLRQTAVYVQVTGIADWIKELTERANSQVKLKTMEISPAGSGGYPRGQRQDPSIHPLLFNPYTGWHGALSLSQLTLGTGRVYPELVVSQG